MLYAPPSDILQRVFCWNLYPTTKTGTCFAVPIGDKHCFITARHLLKDKPSGSSLTIQLYVDNAWQQTDVVAHYSDKDNVDIAILETPLPFQGGHSGLELSFSNMYLGQDVFFLGFPYFGRIDYPAQEINNGFPIPLVKKGIYSGTSGEIHYVDGHNNEGFSGGPVIYYDFEVKKYKICSVLSAYITHTRNLDIPGVQSIENSGIIVSYKIGNAVNLIRQIYGDLPNANKISA